MVLEGRTGDLLHCTVLTSGREVTNSMKNKGYESNNLAEIYFWYLKITVLTISQTVKRQFLLLASLPMNIHLTAPSNDHKLFAVCKSSLQSHKSVATIYIQNTSNDFFFHLNILSITLPKN